MFAAYTVASTNIVISPEIWQFHLSNTSCNFKDDIHQLEPAQLTIVPGKSPLSAHSMCHVMVKLLDITSVGADVQLRDAILCGNSIDIIGFCGSIQCAQVICVG